MSVQASGPNPERKWLTFAEARGRAREVSRRAQERRAEVVANDPDSREDEDDDE